MSQKKLFALSERHRMRSDGSQVSQPCARAPDYVVLNGKNRFGNNSQFTLEQQVVHANDRASQRIFDGSEQRVGRSFVDGAKRRIERCTWNGGNPIAQQLDCGRFAECAVFALEGYAHDWFRRSGHGSFIVITVYREEATPAPGKIEVVTTKIRFTPTSWPVHVVFCAEPRTGVIMWLMSVKQVSLVRPQPTEYAAYYEKYVSLVPGTDVLAVLEAQQMLMTQLLGARSEREGNFRYAPDKWTVKELVGHVTDTERIFTYRALRIARGDTTPMEGFEQDDYVKNGGFHDPTSTELTGELDQGRTHTLALYQGLRSDAWP